MKGDEQMEIITNEMVNGFKAYLFEEEKSEATIEKYMRDIRFFREWLNGGIDKSVVVAYKRELCERYAPKSVNSILSSLNALFVFMGRHELKVKTLKIQKQIFSDTDKELTKAEYERLLTAAKNKEDDRLYYLMQTIGSTGIRISELKYITCEAVNLGRADISCKGKRRQVFLPKQLCKMLKSYIKQHNIKSGPVFVTRNGKALNRSNVWKMLKNICKDACVSKAKVFPHNFRHLFARIFYSIQKDIVRLADILGHTSVNTTRIYTMEDGEIHRKQIQRLGLLRC